MSEPWEVTLRARAEGRGLTVEVDRSDLRAVLAEMDQHRARLADLGMVCDAYGLPRSAVALAKHLSSNADLDHAVNMETIRMSAARLAGVRALALDASANDGRVDFDRLMGIAFGQAPAPEETP